VLLLLLLLPVAAGAGSSIGRTPLLQLLLLFTSAV
jgi:hypothetical protein